MTEIIAVPSQFPGGLDAVMAAHFGHCEVFTLVTVCNGEITDVSVVPTPDHEHGGCMVPVRLLASLGVTSVVSGGMGQRPLAGFYQVGIWPLLASRCETVRAAVHDAQNGGLIAFEPAAACGGGHTHAE